MLHLIKLMRAVAKRAPDRYIVAIYCCRDLIRKLLVQDRTKRLGNMKVSEQSILCSKSTLHICPTYVSPVSK